jgi:hypothetical protein
MRYCMAGYQTWRISRHADFLEYLNAVNFEHDPVLLLGSRAALAELMAQHVPHASSPPC